MYKLSQRAVVNHDVDRLRYSQRGPRVKNQRRALAIAERAASERGQAFIESPEVERLVLNPDSVGVGNGVDQGDCFGFARRPHHQLSDAELRAIFWCDGAAVGTEARERWTGDFQRAYSGADELDDAAIQIDAASDKV